MASKNISTTTSESTKERYTFFYGKDSPFSQHRACTFTVDEVEYNCAEQYMMHQKAVMFGDKAMAVKIMDTEDPKKQKAYGRQVTNFDAKKWSDSCRDIVKKGNLGKFSQNDELWEAMAATVGTVLVEASGRDRLWGIGLGAKNPKALNKMTWRGKNWLGYTLTAVRDELLLEKGAVDNTDKASESEPSKTDKEKSIRSKRPASASTSKGAKSKKSKD